MGWIKTMAWLLAAAVVLLLALLAWGGWRWRAATLGLTDRLEAARRPPMPAVYSAARELEGLPPPVQRFFRAALKDGQPMIAALDIEHRGSFDLAADGPANWKPFTSAQHVVAQRPGFVWDGRIAAAPGLAVHVHDAYVAGEGLLRPAVLGLFTLAELRGTGPETGGIAQGELLRWLAEAAWYPTALLPSQGVQWQAVDDASAIATLHDGSVRASLLLRFDARTGLIDSVRAEARGRTVAQSIVPTPWEGRWWNYAERDGLQVPMSGDVAWLTPEGRRPYWRGDVTALRYAFAP